MALKAFSPLGGSDNLLGDLIESTANPYPGLRPFNKDEDWLFFGRKRHVFDLLDILAREHFVSAIGPSGCGKSSLIRAGVLPALEKGTAPKAGSLWTSATMRPGSDPFDSLVYKLYRAAGAEKDENAIQDFRDAKREARRDLLETLVDSLPLPTKEHRLLLLVDQFEELFHRSQNPRPFLDMLVDLFERPIDRLYIIITMRTDYIGDCTRYFGLAEVINETFYLIPRLDENELRDAITRPAQAVGGGIAPELASALLWTADQFAEANAESDHLPLMQHALMWMWSRAKLDNEKKGPGGDGDSHHVILGTNDYERVGKLMDDEAEDALSNHATEIREKLVNQHAKGKSAEEKRRWERIIEALFRQLVESHDNRYIRRPARIADVIDSSRQDSGSEAFFSIDELRPIIERFRQNDCSFIDVRGKPGAPLEEETELDIGHEALIRRWKLLRRWAAHEAQAGQELQELVKESIKAETKARPTLDKLELDSFRKNWGETLNLLTGTNVSKLNGWERFLWRRKHNEIPNESWAQRYLTRLAEKERYRDATLYRENKYRGGSQDREAAFYNSAKWFWRDSKRKRTGRIGRGIAMVVGLAFATASTIAWNLQSLRAGQNMGDLKSTLAEASSHSYGRDSVALRNALMKQVDNQESLRSCGFGCWPLFANEQTELLAHYEDVKRLFTSYADLHSIPHTGMERNLASKGVSAPQGESEQKGDSPSKENASSNGNPQSSEDSPWGRLERTNPGLPMGNAVYFFDKDLGDCIAVIDVLGQLSVTCKYKNDPTRAGRWPLAEDSFVTLKTFKEPDDGDLDQIQVALRTARIIYDKEARRLIAASPDRKVRSCKLSRLGTSDLDKECNLLLDLDHEDQKGDASRELRGLTFDESGEFLAAIYRSCDPIKEKDVCDGLEDNILSVHLHRMVLKEDSQQTQPNSNDSAKETAGRGPWRYTFDTKLLKDGAKNDYEELSADGTKKVDVRCTYVLDPELIQLRRADEAKNSNNEIARLSTLFTDNQFCEWSLVHTDNSVGNETPIRARALKINQDRRLQLDLTSDGDQLVIGVGPQFLRGKKALPRDSDAKAEWQLLHPARFFSTEDLLALRFFDEDRVLSSNRDGHVTLSPFEPKPGASKGKKRLLTGERNVKAFALDRKNGVAYGIADCRGENCRGAMDLLQWRLRSKKSASFGSPSEFHWFGNEDGNEKPIPEKSISGLPERLNAEKKKLIKERLEALYGEELIATCHPLTLEALHGEDPIATCHPLRLDEKSEDFRQLVVISTSGKASIFNIEPLRRLFSLYPLHDAELRNNLYQFETSELNCPRKSDVEGCWLELRFDLSDKGELQREKGDTELTPVTLVYHFPKLLQSEHANAKQ